MSVITTLLAFVAVTVRVLACPEVIEAGLAVIVTVGAVTGATVTVTCAVAVPAPLPLTVIT